MCGIIAIAGNRPVQHRLLDSLQRLEYRGYDSAGLATLDDSGAIRITRAVGKIAALESALADSPMPGDTGIGHTRWATHGAPTEANAHPHSTERVAVVHNGIIENFAALREELKRAGHLFTSETDTEVIARLLDYHIDRYGDLQEAFAATLRRLRGAFAIAVIFKDQPGLVMGARLGSPLVVGMAEGEMVLGSDAIAVAPHTNRVIYLDEGDWVVLRPEECTIFDRNDTIADRPVQTVAASYALAEKGEHRHFMMKEIHEQPEGITRTLGRFVAPSARRLVALEGVDFAAARELNIIACGTASLAGEIARYWFEDIAGLPTRVEIASEFRYRNPALAPDGIALAISQSGETADTKAAFELCKQRGQTCVALVNVMDSTIARLADLSLPTLAGPEIGVASTKAFTAQLAALACLTLQAARARGRLNDEEIAAHIDQLLHAPRLIADVIAACDAPLRQLSQRLRDVHSVLFLGRGPAFPLALEGALKLKEISYIHAEGYAAGELKHGPIALVDEYTPIVVLNPAGRYEEKTRSNIQEVAARGGPVILIADEKGTEGLEALCESCLTLPQIDPFIQPIVYAAPVQLLAYYTALAKGTDVDQPRNLAKSVTVE